MRQGFNKPTLLLTVLVLTSTKMVFLPKAQAGKLDAPFEVKEVRVRTGDGPVEIQNNAFDKDGQKRSWQERIQNSEQDALRAAEKLYVEQQAKLASNRRAAAASLASTSIAPNASTKTPTESNAAPTSGTSASPTAPNPKSTYLVTQHDEILSTKAPNFLQDSPLPSAPDAPVPKRRHVKVDGVDLPFGLSDFADETDEKLVDPKVLRRAKLNSLHSRNTGKLDADGKPVSENIDPHSTLRNFNKIAQELRDRRSDKNARWQNDKTAELGGEDRLPSTNLWNSQTEAWNRTAPSRIEMRPTFEGDLREMKRHETPERENRYTGASRFAGKYAEQLQKLSATNDRGINPRYGADASAPIGERRYTDYARVNNLSMQDINRYQFRRSHPTTTGMPVVGPGSDVDTTRFRSGNK